MLKRVLLHLLAPDSAPGISAVTEADTASMDTVFDKLGLDPELRGEKPKVKDDAKPKAKTEEEAEGDGTEGNKENEGEESRDGSEEGEGDEGKEGQEGAETEAAEQAPEFSPEQQAWLDAQKETAETELAEMKTKADDASKRVEELESELAAASAQPVAVANLHPAFLADSEADLAKIDKEFAAFEKWALANWDGVEETAAADGKPAQPAYTAQQVRARYAEIKELRERVIPSARQSLQQRAQFDAAAKERYPDLFNPKHADYRVAETVLKQAPGLKAIFPNIKIFIGDALRGERARVAEEKAKAAKTKAPAKVAPKLPVRPAPGSKSAVAPKAKTGGEVNAAKFMELGGDRNALVAMLQDADLPVSKE